MTDQPWTRDEVQSPCVRVCLMHPTERICTGCFRTLEEIAGWSAMTADARREIIAALPARAERLSRRRGGRAARLQG